MTPTLLGRWQTRLWTLGTVGLLITFFFAAAFVSDVPFVILFWVALLGLGWDAVYNLVQRRRWDSDWPPVYQLGAGVLEGVVLYILIKSGVVLGVPPEVTGWMFLSHYTTVWFSTFLMTQGPLRILYPQWRFRGGQFGRHPASGS